MATAQIQRADRTFGRVVSLKNFAPPNGGNHSKQGSADPWADFSNIFRSRDQPLSQSGLQSGWGAIFGPLRQGKVDDLVVVGQIGQSLDGRIATESGHSKYINGPAGLAHLHRLRSLVDGIVIGVGTAIADDPQLTVRRVSGSHPTRVVIDPKGRLGSDAKVFAADGTRRLLIVAQGTRCAPPPGVETIALPASDGQIAPAAILAALAGHGLRRVLIEGGAVTVSRFLAAGCLDRLHVMVAPVILGAGHASFSLPPVERADQALRIPTHVHQIEDEVLYDCDLAAQRVPVGAAKTST
jgi:diaminohydroxyphosphoribosylaminopyrimidine deaminase/5-amino-6-(5-phosphoribosylamino)uracil reductase